MTEGLYEGLGEVIYWSITPKGLLSFRSGYNGDFIFYILSRLETSSASTRDLYNFLPKEYKHGGIKRLLSNLFMLEQWGWIEREVRWED